MPSKKVTFDTVCKIAATLPGVEESTAYGGRCLKINGKIFSGIAINKSAEPNSLFIKMSFENRDELIEGAPEIYYIAEHYEPYPCVLVRLSRIKADVLRDLLTMGWRFMTSKSVPRKRPRRR